MAKIKRKEQAILTRQSIVQAMQKLLKTKSFQDIQIKDICSEAGISNGNFYNYFTSKNHIILQLVEFYEDEFCLLIQEKNEIPKKEYILFAFENYMKVVLALGKDLVIEYHQYQLITRNNLLVKPTHTLYKNIYNIINSMNKDSIITEDSIEEITTSMIIVFRAFIFEWVLNTTDYDLIADMKKQMSRYISLFII